MPDDNVIDFQQRSRIIQRELPPDPTPEDDEETVRLKATAITQMKLDAAFKHPLGLYELCFRDDRGGPITVKWFHQEWFDLWLSDARNVLIEASRGLSKTTATIAMVMWLLGHNPNLRIKIICGNEKNAAKRLSEIRSHINSDYLYQMVFPGIEEDPDLSNDKLTLNLKRERHGKDATIEAKGVMSDGTGDRADLIIFDDACTSKNSVDEPSMRPKVYTKINGDWLKTLNPRDGRVWYIFTPWDSDDANARTKRAARGDPETVYKRYAHGVPGDPFHSIFPELFPPAYLKAQYTKSQEEGGLDYAKAYLCLLLSEGERIVQPDWLRTYTAEDLPPHVLERCVCIISADPLGSKVKGSRQSNSKRDFLGISILLVDLEASKPVNGRPKAPWRIYVVDAYQMRPTMQGAAQHLVDLARAWKAFAILIEVAGAQALQTWVRQMAPELTVVDIPVLTGKRQRLEGITPLLQDATKRQHVLFSPWAVSRHAPVTAVTIGGDEPQTLKAKRTLRHQILNFPTLHDDVLDGVVQGIEYVKGHLIPLMREDEDDDEDEDNPLDPGIDVQVGFIDF
jgi:hypothetical protein